MVDFIHFDVWRGRIPDAIPLVGGHYTALFPIWNVADMAIVVGVIGIIATQGRYHRKLVEIAEAEKTAVDGPSDGESESLDGIAAAPVGDVGDGADRPPAESQ